MNIFQGHIYAQSFPYELFTRLKLASDPARAKLLRGITGSEVVPTVAVKRIAAGDIVLSQSRLRWSSRGYSPMPMASSAPMPSHAAVCT
jgi:hypothetical protein